MLQIILFVVSVVVGAIISIAVLRLITKWLCKFTPSYGDVGTALLFGWLASQLVQVVIFAIFHKAWEGFGVIISLMIIPPIYGMLVKHPDKTPIGYKNALFIVLIFDLIMLAIWGVFKILVKVIG